jgi:hypothetical protein
MPRLPMVRMLVAALFLAAPSLLAAQSIAPPRRSPVWNVGSTTEPADSTHQKPASKGWTEAKGATVGGVIGALAGMGAGLWKCHSSGAYAGSSCGGDMAWGAALFGGLGLLLGSIAGADAERHGH